MGRFLAGILLLSWCISVEGKTLLVTFTGYSVSPPGEPCGAQNAYGEGVSFAGTGMLEILEKLRGKLPESELEMRAFTYFNVGQGLACTAPFDGESDHKAAEEFLQGKVASEDFVIVAGHSYGGIARHFSPSSSSGRGQPVHAFVLKMTHSEVDGSAAVQSLLERLALSGSISVSNEASVAEAISQ